MFRRAAGLALEACRPPSNKALILYAAMSCITVRYTLVERFTSEEPTVAADENEAIQSHGRAAVRVHLCQPRRFSSLSSATAGK